MGKVSALLSILSGGSGYLIGAGAVILAFLATYVRGRLSGAKLERAKQASAEARARDISDQVENDIGAMTPEQRREALRQWAR